MGKLRSQACTLAACVVRRGNPVPSERERNWVPKTPFGSWIQLCLKTTLFSYEKQYMSCLA